MTDASGAELEYSDYAPFGSQRAHTGTNTSDYKYTDQELDAENGLYNYNARLYDPFIGRFISPDTIVPNPYNPQSLNRYSYCLNNPLIYTDPSGHAEEDDEWAAYMAMAQQAYSLYQVWPQMGGIMLHDFLMGFDSFQTGFEVRAVDPDTMILTSLLAGVRSSGGGGGNQAAQDPRFGIDQWDPEPVSNLSEIDKVALNTLSRLNKFSAYFGIEVGGLIYESGGSYYATPWVTNWKNDSVSPFKAKVYVPNGANVVAIYHTHPGYSTMFSPEDINLANDMVAKYPHLQGIYAGLVDRGEVIYYASGFMDIRYAPLENVTLAIRFSTSLIGNIPK